MRSERSSCCHSRGENFSVRSVAQDAGNTRFFAFRQAPSVALAHAPKRAISPDVISLESFGAEEFIRRARPPQVYGATRDFQRQTEAMSGEPDHVHHPFALRQPPDHRQPVG